MQIWLHINLSYVLHSHSLTKLGFEPLPADDISYEADALLTKPPRLDKFSKSEKSRTPKKQQYIKKYTNYFLE